MRCGGGLLALDAAGETERAAARAADQWLAHLTGRADLARALARTAAGADDPAPFDPRPYHLVDRYVIRGQMRAPGQWLTAALTPSRGDPERAAAEADLVAFAWSLPWERERTRRLVDRAPDPVPRTWFYQLVFGRPGAGILFRGRPPVDLAEKEAQLRVARRALILTAAISAYQMERGGPPAALADLVDQGYLDRLPDDPYAGGKPFGYRVSSGEMLRAQQSVSSQGRAEDRVLTLDVERGRALVWSVGADRIDQGGHVPPDSQRAEDFVFLAPLPPRGPK
ncbi:hypothetical protein [Frigoriglobus tundricola]|uniref:Uncharacterized protein n=1 Tax=Frigoriglobus tundricola TaxID=2774151 RepID=A0A6M5Z1Y3_9BACT|nr:hypothetical protein [Frigoriglobus tundricola]QJW99523.1 hypothetical protein FTUN_7135 [Frigoriglobus tundricola]